MNTAWTRLLEVADPGTKDKLTKAQRLWIAYRDADAACVIGDDKAQVRRLTLTTGLRTAELEELRGVIRGTDVSGMKDAIGEYRRVDERLNAVWDAVQRGAGAARREKLVKAQRLWIRFRDAHCLCVTDDTEGNQYAWWLLRATAQRTELLKGLGEPPG